MECLPHSSWSDQIQSLSGLFVVSTPIGHLEDITLRALVTLAAVDCILCEDTRVTRLLLSHYGISKPCYSYHSHNEKQKLSGIIHLLNKGEKIALVSDRGTPIVSDPGFLLVRECYKHGVPVHAVPGASSVMVAAVLSEFSCASFFFQGFLPMRKRSKTIQFLSSLPAPVILFEAPHRLGKTLQELIPFFGDRTVCLVREMTKKFEQRLVLSLSELFTWAETTTHIGECVLIIKGYEKNELSETKEIRHPPIDVIKSFAYSTGVKPE
jgi:16S rRNA (cytidine1402-2'-O)-methyltransferase